MSVAVGAIIQGLGLLASLAGQQQQPEQISPYTEDYMAQLKKLIAQFQSGSIGTQSKIAQNQAQLQQNATQAGSLRNQISGIKAPAPNAFMDQFIANIPGYQQIAQGAAQQAAEIGGRTAQENAQNASIQGAENAARATPGGAGFSGAQTQAVAQGAANPLAEALQNMAQLNSQNYMSTFNNLAGQGQGLAFQGQQQGFENALGQLQAQLGALSQQGNVLGNIGSQNVNVLGQQLGGLQNLFGQYGQNAGPTYSQPSTYNQFAPLGNALGGLGQMIAGLSTQQDNNQTEIGLDELNALLQSFGTQNPTG